MAEKLRLVLSVPILRPYHNPFHQSQPLTTSFWNKTHFRVSGARMASSVPNTSRAKIIDSHLHVWASPQEVTQHLIIYFFFHFPSIATAMLTYLYIHIYIYIGCRRKINILTFQAMNPLYLGVSISCFRYEFCFTLQFTV